MLVVCSLIDWGLVRDTIDLLNKQESKEAHVPRRDLNRIVYSSCNGGEGLSGCNQCGHQRPSANNAKAAQHQNKILTLWFSKSSHEEI